jgi:membrane protease YdiL (CAAX protease family)
LKSEKTVMYVFLYLAGILTLLVPVFWIKKFYGLEKNALGIRRGKWATIFIIVIGIAAGIVCFLIVSIIWGPQLRMNRFLTSNFLNIISLPFSILGFQKFVLAPISEEIFDRGFLYGYLRSKLGISLGITVQSILFTLLHTDYISGAPTFMLFEKFLLGLILGVLYEVSGTLYTSMICHGIFNYLISIAEMQQRLAP